ncbi:hypothetical protein SAMN02799631_01604 [Methylobacterium sp. 174MFSha1.1]|uniref:hypothetical protein n=1 Tax=Methylobacterium sp. 174MFSha1.1 TaxID=1502749 RepID=UPI0008F42BCA|nr:hypothetical protein [Methylobacterium sp. 174MFSha1.1]SFU65324.1 hypothetical protein SAMN02799631_01604 [Methylobacterium sp. 174MFSha1.1]
MLSVIEEITGDGITLDADHVRARIGDWRGRINDLYRQVTDWFPHLCVRQGDTTVMNEEMMRAYGVPPVRLPILRLSDAAVEVAAFVPDGLWIIGVNGRLDLSTRSGRFLILDRAGLFETPRWTIAPALDRLAAEPLSQAALATAMA